MSTSSPSRTASPSFIGAFESIVADRFPVHHELMYVAVQIRGEPHQRLAFAIELRREQHLPMGRIDGSVTTGAEGGSFIPVKFAGIVFPEPRPYIVTVLIDGRAIATQALHVQKKAAPRSQTAH